MTETTTRRDYPEVMTPQDLSEYLSVPVGTIYQWRSRRTGPDAVRVGNRLRYRKATVDLWLAAGGDRPAPRRRGRPQK